MGNKKSSNWSTKVLIIIIILFSGLILFNIFSDNNQTEDKIISNSNNETKIVNIEEYKYITKTDTQASVTVDVTPTVLGVNENQNIFEVSFQTHSVEIDYDFSQVIVLKDNLGKVYEALEWAGGRGGHHVSGDIIFPAIDDQATQVEINVNGVSNVDRVFKWDLL